MRKRNLNSRIEKSMLPELERRNWKTDKGVYFKEMSSNITLAFTLFSVGTTRYNGGIASRIYGPSIFLIHTNIEKAYKQFQDMYHPWCPLATGSLLINSTYFRLGCLPFFKDAVPQVRTNIVTKFHPDSYNNDNWCAFIDHPHFIFSEQRPNSEGEKLLKAIGRLIAEPKLSIDLIEDKGQEEFDREIFEMLNQVEQAATWLYNQASSTEQLVSLAIQASSDLNIAILFGPDWPYRVMFLLLTAEQYEHADAFRVTLEKIKWTGLLLINHKSAMEKMEALYHWVKGNECKKALTEPTSETDRTHLIECIRKLITPPFTILRHRDPNTQMAPFALALPRVFCDQDPRLLQSNADNSNSP